MDAKVPQPVEPDGEGQSGGPQEEWLAALLPSASQLVAADAARSTIARLAANLPDGAALAIPVSGRGPRPRERAPFALRVGRGLGFAVAAARMRVLAARAGARLRAVGLRPQRIDIARPAGGRRVGLGGRRLAMAPNALVVGYRGAAAPTPLDQAIEAARRRLGAPLQIEGGRVLAAGTLMAELSGPGRRYLLRLAGPANAASQARAEATLEGLLACGAPSSVRERLVAPLARGRVGPMRWSLEPRRPGSHPAAVDERLWQSCLEFLIGLRSTPVPPSAPLAAAFSDDVRVLERHIDVPARRTLSELERRLVDRLGSLDRAWGHGDFHPGNLLVDRGTLDSVLDWDAAHPAALPLLDVLHLSVTAEPRSRRLSHGARCSDELWPLARAGGDARIRAYCAATETPGEPATLLALSEAYWLTRVARDLREFSDRARRDEWLELNLRRPLREIRSS